MTFSDMVRVMELRTEYEELIDDLNLPEFLSELNLESARYHLNWVYHNIPIETSIKIQTLSAQYLNYYDRHQSEIYTPSNDTLEPTEEGIV